MGQSRASRWLQKSMPSLQASQSLHTPLTASLDLALNLPTSAASCSIQCALVPESVHKLYFSLNAILALKYLHMPQSISCLLRGKAWVKIRRLVIFSMTTRTTILAQGWRWKQKVLYHRRHVVNCYTVKPCITELDWGQIFILLVEIQGGHSVARGHY